MRARFADVVEERARRERAQKVIERWNHELVANANSRSRLLTISSAGQGARSRIVKYFPSKMLEGAPTESAL